MVASSLVKSILEISFGIMDQNRYEMPVSLNLFELFFSI